MDFAYALDVNVFLSSFCICSSSFQLFGPPSQARESVASSWSTNLVTPYFEVHGFWPSSLFKAFSSFFFLEEEEKGRGEEQKRGERMGKGERKRGGEEEERDKKEEKELRGR